MHMKICVFGAGAIGGFLGAKLAQAGAQVSPTPTLDVVLALIQHRAEALQLYERPVMDDAVEPEALATGITRKHDLCRTVAYDRTALCP